MQETSQISSNGSRDIFMIKISCIFPEIIKQLYVRVDIQEALDP